MLTQITNVIEKNDVIMPEVDLVNVRSLVDNLTQFEKAGQMSFDDVANLSALLPDAARSLGIESYLTYESSTENYKLAHEAISKGMKATLAAVIGAAIAIILRFFKYRRSKDYKDGGANNETKGSASSAEAHRKEIMKTAPVLEKQVEEFRTHMDFIASESGLDTMDGDVYPELVPLTASLSLAVTRFTNNPVPSFERGRDKARLGELLNAYSQLLGPGSISYHWVSPFNFFFMTDRESYPHQHFLESLFHFIKVNKSFATTIPDLTLQLSEMRFQPNRHRDFQGPGAEVYIQKINSIIENNFAPSEMATAVGITPIPQDNYQTFILIAEAFKDHVSKLFGTNLYSDTHGDEEFKRKRMREYYEFLTTDTRNEVAGTWTTILGMVDQCAELLTVAEDTMVAGKRVNFLAEAKEMTERLKARYDDEMRWTAEQSKHYSEQQIENLGEMKRIGVFLTTLVRFVADFSRVVDYMTRWDDKLNNLESDMQGLCKLLIEVNTSLRKIKE